jgi:hypothetical protein
MAPSFCSEARSPHEFPVSTARPAASLDLALIGNCTVGALVDNRASLVWCCMPRFDSAPVFDALLHSAEGLPLDGP